MSMSEEQTCSIVQHAKADLLARLEVLLEGGSGGDGLAGILMDEGIGVTGVGHAASADLGVTAGSRGRGGGSPCGGSRSRGGGRGGPRGSGGGGGRCGSRSGGGSATVTHLQVLLEGGSGGDGLAGILVLEGIGVTGVGHAAGANLIEDGGGDASSELGVEGGGASNKGSESNNVHGYRNLSKLKE